MFQRHLHRLWLRARQGEVLSLLESLQRSQWLSRDEIRELQWRRLRDLLVHAGRKVPYYRTLFAEAGIDPAGMRGPEEMERIPVLTKDRIRGAGRDLLSSDAAERGATQNATGGSTGEPLVFHQDRRYRLHRQAVMYRGFAWCGWRLGGPLAYLWGSDVDSRSHKGLGALRDRLFGVLWIDAFRVEEKALDRILEKLRASSPDILIGYASSLRHLARHALARGSRLKLRAVETSAELLIPDARAEIEEAFGCRALDRYGCREAGVVAHECGAAAGWHINAETVHAEVNGDGHLLLTPLMNYSMPLIRYRNEDLAEMAEDDCPCGRRLPRLGKIVGRQADIIRSPSGMAIHGEFFTHLFYGVEGVREFQVVQETPEDLVIRVVAGERFSEGKRREIEETILEHGDARFRIRWERVQEIPRTASGKLRFTISRVGDGAAR